VNASIETLASGWRVERFSSVGSTNDIARGRALAGDPGQLWIIADEQTAGRGRLGRNWVSPRGNLHASALLIDPSPAPRAAELGFVAGVALRRAVADLAPAAVGEIRLKWPNDLVWRGAKLAGLLAEGIKLDGSRLACVVGIGVNAAVAPEGMPYATTSLAATIGRAMSVDELFARLAFRFAEMLDVWDHGLGFASIRAQWLKHAAGIGGPIHVAGPKGALDGAFEGLDDGGRLLVRTTRGLETIEAGDIFLLDQTAGRAPSERKAAT